MSDSIREQIIQLVVTKLADIKVLNAYNTDIGDLVSRVRAVIEPWELPGVSVFPQQESAEKRYGKLLHTMPVNIEGLIAHGDTNSSVVAEKILADLIFCMTGIERTLTFTSGGTFEVDAGDVIVGATSAITARVIQVTLTGGSWALGTAAGTFRLRLQSGNFVAENLNVGANLNVATIAANSTLNDRLGGLIDDIVYMSGGPSEYPASGNQITGCPVTFEIKYFTLLGNPNSQ